MELKTYSQIFSRACIKITIFFTFQYINIKHKFGVGVYSNFSIIHKNQKAHEGKAGFLGI